MVVSEEIAVISYEVFIFGFPIIMLFAGLILASININYEKPIGVILSVAGILEMLPMIINLGFDLTSFTPLPQLLLLSIIGVTSLIAGVTVYYLLPKQKNLFKKKKNGTLKKFVVSSSSENPYPRWTPLVDFKQGVFVFLHVLVGR